MASPSQSGAVARGGLARRRSGGGPQRSSDRAEGEDEAALTAAAGEAKEAFEPEPVSAHGGPRREPPRSLEMGLDTLPAANLALISTPGDYAAAEAMKALRLGLNVMMFSDNVPIADEVALKRYARARDLMVMGPDCGTAILNGVPLGFANVVSRGAIGVVGASGTGLQQVTCLSTGSALGVSQAIGAGGHDLRRDVGGITMLQGLEALAADGATKVDRADLQAAGPRGRREPPRPARKAGSQWWSPSSAPIRKPIAGPQSPVAATLEDAALAAHALLRGKPPKARAAVPKN